MQVVLLIAHTVDVNENGTITSSRLGTSEIQSRELPVTVGLALLLVVQGQPGNHTYNIEFSFGEDSNWSPFISSKLTVPDHRTALVPVTARVTFNDPTQLRIKATVGPAVSETVPLRVAITDITQEEGPDRDENSEGNG